MTRRVLSAALAFTLLAATASTRPGSARRLLVR